MATESPPRKRAKLSLKLMKKVKNKQATVSSARRLDLGTSSSDNRQLETQGKLVNPGENDLEQMEANSSSQVEISQPPPPYAGFYNVGNTCYLNSVLQTLRYCPDFFYGIERMTKVGQDLHGSNLDFSPAGDIKMDNIDPYKKNLFLVIKELAQVFDLMCAKEDSFRLKPTPDVDMSVNPENILEALRVINPMFEGYLQHDAQELLCSLLSVLQDVCQDFLKELSQDDGMTTEEEPDIKVDERCTTPTSQLMSNSKGREIHGSLKGGCSPNVKLRTLLTKGTETPMSAKKQLEFEQKKLFLNGDKDGKRTLEEVDEVREQNINGRKRRRKAKSEGPGVDAGGDNQIKANDKSENKKTNHGFKKKRLGMGRILKLGNQSTLLSKFPLIKRKKSDPEKELLINSTSVDSSQQQNNNDMPSTPPEQNLKQDYIQGTVTKKIIKQEPNTPKLDTSLSLETSGTPTVTFNETHKIRHMVDMFQGTLVLRTRCYECENYTERREDFFDVSVPVQPQIKEEPEKKEEPEQSFGQEDSNHSTDHHFKKMSLEWALSQFASGEKLAESNKYYCDRCMHLTEAERLLLFDKLPQVMVIHLKRFSALPHTFSPGGSIPKINDALETPAILSLQRWCTKDCNRDPTQYRLFGIVAHSGISSSSGHYFSYVRVPTFLEPGEVPTEPTRWVLFDDEHVSLAMQQEVDEFLNTSSPNSMDSPYLLFYQKERMTEPMNTEC